MNNSVRNSFKDPTATEILITVSPEMEFHTQRIIQQGIYAVIFFLSMVGNAAMFAVLLKGRRLCSSKNVLLMNMILAESLVAMTSIPFDFALLFQDEGWVFGSFMCHVLWPLQTAPFGALVLTLTAMSVQRYKGIVRKLRKRKPSVDASYCTVASIWVFSVIIVIPFGVFLRLEDGKCSETWGKIGSQVYTVVLFAFHYAIPLTVITYCYARIANRIRRGHEEGHSIISGTRQARLKRSRRHVRAVRMVILFVVVFAICMLPHQVVWLWMTFGDNVEHSSSLLTFAYMFTFTSSVVNPLVYFTHNPALRARLFAIVACRSLPRIPSFRRSSIFGSSDSSHDCRV